MQILLSQHAYNISTIIVKKNESSKNTVYKTKASGIYFHTVYLFTIINHLKKNNTKVLSKPNFVFQYQPIIGLYQYTKTIKPR